VADVGVTVEEDTAELKHTTPMPSGSEGLRLGGDRERVLLRRLIRGGAAAGSSRSKPGMARSRAGRRRRSRIALRFCDMSRARLPR